jgi:hypothetical protein
MLCLQAARSDSVTQDVLSIDNGRCYGVLHADGIESRAKRLAASSRNAVGMGRPHAGCSPLPAPSECILPRCGKVE